MSFIKQLISGYNISIYSSYYIKVDKNRIYLRSFRRDASISCSTSFEVDTERKNQIVRLSELDTHNTEIKLYSVSGSTTKVNPFNHPRLIYHKFEYAEIFIRFLIKHLKKRWWESANCIIFQLGYDPEGGMTDVEAKMLAESLEHCGARQCYIINPSYSMTEGQIEELYAEINSSRIAKVNKLSKGYQEKLSWPFAQ